MLILVTLNIEMWQTGKKIIKTLCYSILSRNMDTIKTIFFYWYFIVWYTGRFTEEPIPWHV